MIDSVKTVGLGILLFLAILFSGCSTYEKIAKPKIENFIKQNNLGDYTAKACYDLIDKKDCPKGMLQYDINILPFVPFDSRFCFGLDDKNSTIEEDMICYDRDFIK